MVLYAFILLTVVMAFIRGREGQPFVISLAIEAGFLVAVLHYGFFTQAFEDYVTYPVFLLGWVLPIVVACQIADGAGRLMRRRWDQRAPKKVK